MNKHISFIGSGNMGGAIIKAACQAIDPKQIFITDYQPEKARELAGQTGCQTVDNNRQAVLSGDYIFLCVKPQVMGSVLAEISPLLNECLEKKEEKVLVSIAAGLTIETLRGRLAGRCREMPIVRIMPNMPVTVGKGMLAMAAGPNVPEYVLEDIKKILARAGQVDHIPENLMDAFTVVSGCTPAFVYMFIEALADGGVMTGLSRQQALTYAAQAVMGSAAMVLETGQHPGVLKDAVCSPKGSTIAGVAALERGGLRSAAMDAVWAGYQRNIELGKD